MKKILLIALLSAVGLTQTTFAASYQVKKVLYSGDMMINGTNWIPKNTCPQIKTGDNVVFVRGNVNGQCVAATIAKAHTKETCELWCDRF